ncbi:hypothetical protein LTR62_000467 [Meristemomyces frigidus]|uniref:DNA replication ATP-dependent helicase/nuclease n=1 Tax=Meristemomyces frigidus TaxID=1508187 RepID=A0AAN7YIH9_9PEZI|nr:hypothetical protein LTR62_000467 [Meristemomyces frigidus]
MLSATTVGDAFDCIRKAVFKEHIKATSEANKGMVYGSILHEVFQQALLANDMDDGLTELVDKTIQNNVEGLWELGMKDIVLAREEILAKMGELAGWAKAYVAEQPGDASVMDDKNGDKVWMSISKLVAIEEHIWSPLYGLKGNVDATVETTVLDHPRLPTRRLIAPLEVKTGRTTQSVEHRAQTALYTLLLSDRYDVAVKAGILYYLESSTTSRIAPPAVEIRQMIQSRNQLVAYIYAAKHPDTQPAQDRDSASITHDIEDAAGLPPVLKNPFKCGRCYAQQVCFTYHALGEGGSAVTAGMVGDGKKNHGLVWQEAVGHLVLDTTNKEQSQQLQTWFRKWDRLLTLEEGETSRVRKELWTTTSAEREAIGRCFGNLVLYQDLTSTAPSVTQADGLAGSGGKINRYAYVFRKATKTTGATSFAEGTQLNAGEPIVVSSESGQWALANGYVVSATKHDITVAVDRKLGDARERMAGFDGDKNQAYRGIMTVGTDATPSLETEQAIRYRVDKDEFSNGLALVRSNLITLMSSHPNHAKLRQQIIHHIPPSFSCVPQLPPLPQSQLGEMNEDQHLAVTKVLSAQDYALILGMPGTGKTTTIAHLIRALLAEGKTILLTSFTHTAVDNILVKIRDVAPEGSILRLGVPAKINAEVKQFCRLAATPRQSIEEIEEVYMRSRIVATTCMGTNHALFRRRAFDVCIVDEASQITLPTALGPLLHARKFVLVGDHFQLPPLVQNRRALEGGLDVSLFRQLSEEFPEAVVGLGRQYRMCGDVMSLANELIYDGRLRCGNEGVEGRSLRLDAGADLQEYHSLGDVAGGCQDPCWLEEITRPERKVVFADIDASGPEAQETLTSGKNITNHLEATLSAQIVLSLLHLGVLAKSIGVITLYRSQLHLIRQLFRRAGISPEVEIDSADRYQGRDKECIILSFVRCNAAGTVGDLLKDWRRVNVALTRARSKLVMLGSRRTLGRNELLARLLGLTDGRGWTMDLPGKAHLLHTFDFSSQAVVGTGLAPMGTPSLQKTEKEKDGVCRSSKTSPLKASGGGRRASPSRGLRMPGKVFKGRRRARPMKERAEFDVFEDMTADDF